MRETCAATKANGEPCQGKPKRGSRYCPAHSPERAEARRRAAKKAASARHHGTSYELFMEADQLQKRADNVYLRIEKGELERGDGAVMVQATNTALRAVDAKVRIRENDVSERLEELERAVEALQSPDKQL